jgi:hypothetical protein
LRLAPGDTQHNLNTSGTGTTPTFAQWQPDAGRHAQIVRVNIFMQNGTITAESFAGLGELGNGLGVRVVDEDDNVLIDYNDGVPITTHHQFVQLAGVDSFRDTDVGNAEDVVAIRWTVERGGRKLWLRPGERFQFVISDDLTALTKFYVQIQGHYGEPL